MKNFVSLGAGRQSSAMVLMAAHGEITPMPDAAIFADTQWEPASVYKWLDWLETKLPFPVYRVTKGNLAEDALKIHRSKKSGQLYSKTLVPVFTLWPNGDKGQLMRHCTMDYKIAVVRKKIRELKKKESVSLWMGISRDEAHRMKDSQVPYISNRYPLIENMLTVSDCISWMKKHDYPEPPRSACVACPYHSDAEWKRLKRDEPEEFRRAVRWEKEYQSAVKKVPRISSVPYLHASRIPLDEVDFDDSKQLDLFGNECEGMCGV